MNILQLYPKSDYFTGAAIQLRDLALGLAGHGHHVVVATRPNEHWGRACAAANVEHASVPMRSGIDLPSAWALARLIRDHDIQIVHCQKGRARTLALLAGLTVRIPVLVLNRGVSFPLDRWNRLGYTTKRVTAIVAVCESIKRGLVGAGVSAEKIEVIYSGTDLGRFHPGLDGRRIRAELGLGPEHTLVTQVGIRSWRGNDDVLEAMTRVCHALPLARLLFVGAPPPRVFSLRDRAFRRGIGESVHVLGHREDIPEILAASDLVVDASYAGLGLTGSLREALAVETPVIGTNLEGHPELILEGETGLLVPPRNPDALAQAILRILENPTRAKAMGRAGRKRVEAHFSMTQKIQRTEALYERLWAARAATVKARYRLLGRLLPYLRPYWPVLLAGGLLALLVSGAEAFIAWLVKPAMDDIFLKRDVAMLKVIPLALLGAYVTKGVGRFGQSYLMASVGERVIARIRGELYAHIQSMPLAFFASLHSAELMTRVVTDVNRLARLSSTVLVMAVRHVGTIVALLVVMFLREWLLTLIAIAVFPLVGLTIRAIGRKLYKINKRTQQKIAELNVVLQESFTGTKIVKAFGRERLEQERFNLVNDRLLSLALQDRRVDEMAEPVMEVLGALAIMGALWYGGYRVIAGALTPGEFFSFTAAVILLYGPVRQISRMVNTVQQSIASVERVFEILDTPPAIVDAPDARTLSGFSEAIVFEAAGFCYPEAEEWALRDISLTVRKGELVAFVGMSGAGKTTLMELLPRFHDVTTGRITLDRHDVRSVTVASLRSLIGIVTQDTFLFHDSIGYNIGYGKPGATQAEIEHAARLAQAHDFIAALPEAYATPVGERGVKLSGGQAQRLAIARAFLKDPPILILDEATSDLDAESEFLVQQALSELMRGRTVLVIAHRLATVKHADRVVVVHGGRIAEMGTHEELMGRGDGIYRRLATLQSLDALPTL